MRALASQWDGLTANSLEDHIYYTRRYSEALLGSVERQRDIRFAAAWQGKRMTGLLPVTRDHAILPWIVPGGRAWTTPFTFNTMPVLDRDGPVDAAIGIIRSLQEFGSLDWHFPDFYLTGPVKEAFCAALDSLGVPWRTVERYERAIFETGPRFEEHMSGFVPSRRRRDLGRNRRRLEETGAVTHESHVDGPGLERATEAFLDLEKRGWKGERGTALASHPDTLAFARQVFRPAPEGGVRADLLLLDGVPVAAGMIVFDGDTGFTIKGAYDEALAGYSVGLLLEIEVAKSFLEEKWAKRLDSATAGKHVIDFLWPQRRMVGDLYFSLRPGATAESLKRYERFDNLKRDARTRLKRLLRR